MTVVVGYVPNALGEAALSAALVEAERRGTDVVVVNTTRSDRLVDPRWVGDSQVAALRERLEAAAVPVTLRRASSEELAAETLLATAEEVGADLLVIGLRHRTAVGKLLMGSTAQRVLLEAGCSVLAVKPDAGRSATRH